MIFMSNIEKLTEQLISDYLMATGRGNGGRVAISPVEYLSFRKAAIEELSSGLSTMEDFIAPVTSVISVPAPSMGLENPVAPVQSASAAYPYPNTNIETEVEAREQVLRSQSCPSQSKVLQDEFKLNRQTSNLTEKSPNPSVMTDLSKIDTATNHADITSSNTAISEVFDVEEDEDDTDSLLMMLSSIPG